MAMRMHMRARTVENRLDADVLKQVGLSVQQVEEMYKVMALADYEDRFVIPSTHREYAENTFDMKSALRLQLRQWLLHHRLHRCQSLLGEEDLRRAPGAPGRVPPCAGQAQGGRMTMRRSIRALAALLAYPTVELQAAAARGVGRARRRPGPGLRAAGAGGADRPDCAAICWTCRKPMSACSTAPAASA